MLPKALGAHTLACAIAQRLDGMVLADLATFASRLRLGRQCLDHSSCITASD